MNSTFINRTINVILLIFILLGGVAFYFFKEIDLIINSKRYVYNVLFLLPPLFFLLLLNRLKPTLKWLKGNVALIFSVLFLVFIVISYKHHKIQDKKHIDKTGGFISVGIIKGSKVSYGTGYITISYKNNKKLQSEINLIRSKSFVKDVSVGDTVLILSSLDNKVFFLYDKHPANEKIQQCKGGCYYLNGQIVDSLDFQ